MAAWGGRNLKRNRVRNVILSKFNKSLVIHLRLKMFDRHEEKRKKGVQKL